MGKKGRGGISRARQRQIREKNYKQRYGLSLEDFESKYKNQKGKCDCCGKKIPKSGSTNFALDHNHISMRIRGILCRDCNINIISILENKQKTVMGLTYLLKWEPSYVNSLIRETTIDKIV